MVTNFEVNHAIGAGLVLGICAALPLAHLMSSLLYGVSNSDAAILSCVACTLAIIGVFACWLPARRATTLDPVEAIRYE